MKNIFRLLMFVGVMSLAACEDKSGLDNWFDKPAEKNTLELSISQGAVASEDGVPVVEVGPTNQWDMLTFEWTEAEPPTSDYHITGYNVKINVNGGDGADYVTGVLSADSRSVSIRKRDLYKHMYANWAYRFGSPTDMVATIYASIEGGQFYYKPVITKMEFQLTPTEITARQYYLVGEANPNGATVANAIPITMIQPDVFYQTGAVNEGDQKELILKPNSTFILSLSRDSEYPAFVCGDKLTGTIKGTQIPVDGYEMVYVENATEAAKYSKFKTLGAYVNGAQGKHNNYAISIENDDESAVPTGKIYIGRYSTQQAWIVGDAVTGEWKHQLMSWHYQAPDMLYREGHWYDKQTTPNSEGAVKIHGSNGSWGNPTWRPAYHGINPADPAAERSVATDITGFSGDPKWILPAGTDGYYRFELYNADLRMDFVPINVF